MGNILKRKTMPVCPECKGKKEFKIPSSNPLDVYSDGPTIFKKYTCGTCMGKGEISKFALIIYEARGGPAPQRLQRGFA